MDITGFFLLLSGCIFLYLTVKEENAPGIRSSVDKAQPFRCPICTYIYIFREEEEFSSCPRCGTLNKKQYDSD